MTRRPDFLLLGQGKSGTSMVWYTLRENPHIALPELKELNYFSRNRDAGPDWYDAHFAGLDSQAKMVGEIAPSYMRPELIPEIAAFLGPQTKVIFILRRPIERAYSRYLQNICAREKGRTFERIMRTLPDRLARLQETIRLCYQHFGSDRVLPLFYEKDIKGPAPAFEAKILDFLGLPPSNDSARVMARGAPNQGVMPRYLYSGETRMRMRVGERIYILPPRHLIFCAQARNMRVYQDPDADQVAAALARQSQWSPDVPQSEYRMHLRRAVRPAADALEAAFGFDMAHWRCAPRRIAYAPAPPPDRFLKS